MIVGRNGTFIRILPTKRNIVTSVVNAHQLQWQDRNVIHVSISNTNKTALFSQRYHFILPNVIAALPAVGIHILPTLSLIAATLTNCRSHVYFRREVFNAKVS